jgi:DNA-binding NarL/FixJ family response regulator
VSDDNLSSFIFFAKVLKFELGKMTQVLAEKASIQVLLIDSHEMCLGGTIEVLHSQYPDARIFTSQTGANVLYQVSIFQPDLLVIDISLPQESGVMARTNTGMQLLRSLMYKYPKLNIVVQSAHTKALVQIKSEIEAHQGGFTVADKSLSSHEMLQRVNWALQGLTHTRDIQGIYSQLEVKPEWQKLLNLAFNEGLQDKAIAKRVSVSERMVRHYWDKLQIALGIDSEELKNQGKNIRVITQIRAREAGLID